MRVSVIGAGAWGTALANLLCRNADPVTLWAFEPEQVKRMRATRVNELFLPGIALAPNLRFESDLAKAADCDCAVMAVPSKFFRAVATRMRDFPGIAVSVAKGIEHSSGLTMSGVLREAMPGATPAVLSGPSLAMEVARNIPAAAVVLVSKDLVKLCVGSMVFNVVVLAMPLAFLVKLTSDRDLLGDLANSRPQAAVLWAVTVALLASGVFGMIQYLT